MSPARSHRLLELVAAAPPLVAVIVFLARAASVTGTIGFPLDDTWIHLRLAANLASGQGFAINPGEPVACSTAPLWTVLLAGLAKIAEAGVATALVPSLLLALASTMLLHRLLLQRHGQTLALAGAALFGLLPSVVWSAVSGLEVSLFLVLEIAGLLLADHPRRGARLSGFLLLALATQVRPEGAILLALGAILYYWRFARDRPLSLPFALAPIAGTAAIVIPYTVFCLQTVGRPLPTTFYAKTTALIAGPPSLEYLRFAYGLMARENLLLAGLVALGAAAVIRGALARRAHAIDLVALGWVLALPVAYACMGRTLLFAGGAGNFGRYLYVLFPAWIVLAATGARLLTQGGGRVKQAVAAVIAMAAFAGALGPLRARAELYAVNVRNIDEMQVAAATWLRDHVPLGSLVAVNDLGAIAFFSGHRVLDLVGIGTPTVLAYRTEADANDPLHEAATARYLAATRPPLLAVFPDWYPRFLAELEAGGALHPLHAIRIADNRTCGSDLLVIFSVNWLEGATPDR